MLESDKIIIDPTKSRQKIPREYTISMEVDIDDKKEYIIPRRARLIDQISWIYSEYISGTAGDFFSQFTAGSSPNIIAFNKILQQDLPAEHALFATNRALTTVRGVNFSSKDVIEACLFDQVASLKNVLEGLLIYQLSDKCNSNWTRDYLKEYLQIKKGFFTIHPHECTRYKTNITRLKQELGSDKLTSIALVPSTFESFYFMCSYRVLGKSIDKKHQNIEKLNEVVRRNTQRLLEEFALWLQDIKYRKDIIFVDHINGSINNKDTFVNQMENIFGTINREYSDYVINSYIEKRFNNNLDRMDKWKAIMEKEWLSSEYAVDILRELSII